MSASHGVASREFNREHYNQGTAEFLSPAISAEFLASQYAGSSIEEVPITIEEPWNEATETHLRSWLGEAEESQESHRKAGYKLKSRYRCFTAVVICWSAIIFVVNGAIGCSTNDVHHIAILVVNAIGVLVNSLFASLNLGYTYREHFEYEAKFFDMSQDIACTLVRDRDYRMPADAFMAEIRERRKKLAQAPELPESVGRE